MFWTRYENYRNFLSENFQILQVKFSIYLNMRVFVMNKFWLKQNVISGAMLYLCICDLIGGRLGLNKRKDYARPLSLSLSVASLARVCAVQMHVCQKAGTVNIVPVSLVIFTCGFRSGFFYLLIRLRPLLQIGISAWQNKTTTEWQIV